jgi:hypothetical protein
MADEPEHIEGPTPNGGTYALVYVHDDGQIEIVEFDRDDREILRIYSPPKST